MNKLILGLLLLSTSVGATELDPAPVLAEEIIVREDASGNREVFKVSDQVNVNDEESAQAVVESYVRAENKVKSVIPMSELDQVSSTEAWYYWGFNYGYYWHGYNYTYRPYYSWNWGYYNYYYYRWW